MLNLPGSWQSALEYYTTGADYRNLTEKIAKEREMQTVFPAEYDVFRALSLTDLSKVKVVILGQDPYHDVGQAHGLAFSVPHGVKLPPSLRNIYKELAEEYNLLFVPEVGDLTHWAEQGVLLLNATLTVRAHQAGSHQKRGWETFTDSVIRILAEQKENLVFILWGAYAQKKGAFIDRNRHLVLSSAHPSPLSAYNGFFGNHHFSQANQWLTQHGLSPVNW